MNEETRLLMIRERCGLSDLISIDNSTETANYKLQGNSIALVSKQNTLINIMP